MSEFNNKFNDNKKQKTIKEVIEEINKTVSKFEEMERNEEI